MGYPKQFLLFPDRKFVAGTVFSITSQDGRSVGPLVPADNNQGNLLPFVAGTPQDDTQLHAKIVQTGALHSALWAWRDEVGPSEYHGVCDVRYVDHRQHLFGNDAFEGYGLAVLFSRIHRRLFVFRRDSASGAGVSASITCQYRDTDPLAGPNDWTVITISPDKFGPSYAHCNLVPLELSDGALRLMVETWDGNDHDFDMYGSTDGGLTWSKLSEYISRQFGLTQTDAQNPRGSVSGDWIRISYQDADLSNKIRTIVSSDRGASWKQITTIGDAPVTNGDAYDEYSFDILGIDDASGSFLLVLKAHQYEVKFYYGSTDQDWEELTDFTANFFDVGVADIVKRLVLVRDPSRVYAFAWNNVYPSSDSTYNGWIVRSARIDRFLDIDEWSDPNGPDISFPQHNGAHRFEPANIHACWAGERLFFAGGLVDCDDSGNIEAYCVGWDLMGWTQRPFALARGNQGIVQSAVGLLQHEWLSIFGRAAGSGSAVSAFTPWTEVDGGGAVAWSPLRTQFVSSASTHNMYHQLSTGVTPDDAWAAGSLIEWECEVPYSPDCANARVAMLVHAQTAAGSLVCVSVRYKAPSERFVVYDVTAATTLVEETGDTFGTEPYRWRLALQSEGVTHKGQIAWRPCAGATWEVSSVFQLEPDAGGAQLLRCGNLSPSAAGCTSQWRSVQVAGTTGYRQIRYGGMIHGRVCAPNETFTRAGRTVRWGGSGGFDSDYFLESVRYTYGSQNLFTPSPSQPWRSTGVAVTQNIVLWAGASQVFIHDAIAAIGCQLKHLRIEYNNTNTWTSPAAIETLLFDAAPLADTRFGTVKGDMSIMSLGEGKTDFVSGELVDHYMQRANASTPAFKVTEHIGTTIQADGSSSDLVAAGVTTGVDYRILAPDAVHVYSERRAYQWMRLVVAPSARITGPNLDSNFIIGALVVGVTQALDVPLDWTYDDREESNVEELTSTDGTTWTRKRGEPKRNIEARMTGDISAHREAMRGLIRSLSGYQELPMVLVLDSEQLALRRSIVYCRYQGATDHQNQGWYRDPATNMLRPVGDMSMSWVEER